MMWFYTVHYSLMEMYKKVFFPEKIFVRIKKQSLAAMTPQSPAINLNYVFLIQLFQCIGHTLPA